MMSFSSSPSDPRTSDSSCWDAMLRCQSQASICHILLEKYSSLGMYQPLLLSAILLASDAQGQLGVTEHRSSCTECHSCEQMSVTFLRVALSLVRHAQVVPSHMIVRLIPQCVCQQANCNRQVMHITILTQQSSCVIATAEARLTDKATKYCTSLHLRTLA